MRLLARVPDLRHEPIHRSRQRIGHGLRMCGRRASRQASFPQQRHLHRDESLEIRQVRICLRHQ